MKSYQMLWVLALLTVGAIAGSYTNTTSFWQTMVNDNDLHFQVYSGKFTNLLRLRTNRLVLPQGHHRYVLQPLLSHGT